MTIKTPTTADFDKVIGTMEASRAATLKLTAECPDFYVVCDGSLCAMRTDGNVIGLIGPRTFTALSSREAESIALQLTRKAQSVGSKTRFAALPVAQWAEKNVRFIDQTIADLRVAQAAV